MIFYFLFEFSLFMRTYDFYIDVYLFGWFNVFERMEEKGPT